MRVEVRVGKGLLVREGQGEGPCSFSFWDFAVNKAVGVEDGGEVGVGRGRGMRGSCWERKGWRNRFWF